MLSSIGRSDRRPRLTREPGGLPLPDDDKPEASYTDSRITADQLAEWQAADGVTNAEPLGITPMAIIPFDPLLFGNAANNGRMLGEMDAAHAVVQIVNEMAHVLTGRAEIKQKKKPGFDGPAVDASETPASSVASACMSCVGSPAGYASRTSTSPGATPASREGAGTRGPARPAAASLVPQGAPRRGRRGCARPAALRRPGPGLATAGAPTTVRAGAPG